MICNRNSYFIVKADSYEEALSKIITGINSNLPTRELPNEGDIEVTDCQYDIDYELVSEKVESRDRENNEIIFYEKRKDI